MIRRQINAPFAAALVVGVLAAFVPTQVATAGSSDEPSPRCCMGMAYDAARLGPPFHDARSANRATAPTRVDKAMLALETAFVEVQGAR